MQAVGLTSASVLARQIYNASHTCCIEGCANPRKRVTATWAQHSKAASEVEGFLNPDSTAAAGIAIKDKVSRVSSQHWRVCYVHVEQHQRARQQQLYQLQPQKEAQGAALAAAAGSPLRQSVLPVDAPQAQQELHPQPADRPVDFPVTCWDQVVAYCLGAFVAPDQQQPQPMDVMDVEGSPAVSPRAAAAPDAPSSPSSSSSDSDSSDDEVAAAAAPQPEPQQDESHSFSSPQFFHWLDVVGEIHIGISYRSGGSHALIAHGHKLYRLLCVLADIPNRQRPPPSSGPEFSRHLHYDSQRPIDRLRLSQLLAVLEAQKDAHKQLRLLRALPTGYQGEVPAVAHRPPAGLVESKPHNNLDWEERELYQCSFSRHPISQLLRKPELLDIRFFVSVALILQSLMFTYPFTIKSTIRACVPEVRNLVSDHHYRLVMVKILNSFMVRLAARSQKNTAWALTLACMLELTKLSDSESDKFAHLGLSVSYDTLLHFVEQNGAAFSDQLQQVARRNGLASVWSRSCVRPDMGQCGLDHSPPLSHHALRENQMMLGTVVLLQCVPSIPRHLTLSLTPRRQLAQVDPSLFLASKTDCVQLRGLVMGLLQRDLRRLKNDDSSSKMLKQFSEAIASLDLNRDMGTAQGVPNVPNPDMSYLFLQFSSHGCGSTQESSQMLEETMHEKFKSLSKQAFIPAEMDGGSLRVFNTLKDLRRTDLHSLNAIVPSVGLLHLRMLVVELVYRLYWKVILSHADLLAAAKFTTRTVKSQKTCESFRPCLDYLTAVHSGAFIAALEAYRQQVKPENFDASLLFDWLVYQCEHSKDEVFQLHAEFVLYMPAVLRLLDLSVSNNSAATVLLAMKLLLNWLAPFKGSVLYKSLMFNELMNHLATLPPWLSDLIAQNRTMPSANRGTHHNRAFDHTCEECVKICKGILRTHDPKSKLCLELLKNIDFLELHNDFVNRLLEVSTHSSGHRKDLSNLVPIAKYFAKLDCFRIHPGRRLDPVESLMDDRVRIMFKRPDAIGEHASQQLAQLSVAKAKENKKKQKKQKQAEQAPQPALAAVALPPSIAGLMSSMALEHQHLFAPPSSSVLPVPEDIVMEDVAAAALGDAEEQAAPAAPLQSAVAIASGASSSSSSLQAAAGASTAQVDAAAEEKQEAKVEPDEGKHEVVYSPSASDRDDTAAAVSSSSSSSSSSAAASSSSTSAPAATKQTRRGRESRLPSHLAAFDISSHPAAVEAPSKAAPAPSSKSSKLPKASKKAAAPAANVAAVAAVAAADAAPPLPGPAAASSSAPSSSQSVGLRAASSELLKSCLNNRVAFGSKNLNTHFAQLIEKARLEQELSQFIIKAASDRRAAVAAAAANPESKTEVASIKSDDMKDWPAESAFADVIRDCLQTHFPRIKSLYREQFEAISTMLTLKSDMLVLLRTGFGKSLIFHVGAAALNRLQRGSKVLVLVPLKSLSADQRKRLAACGIGAIDYTEDEVAKKDADWCFVGENEDKPLIFMNPESFEAFLIKIGSRRAKQIKSLAIDETHCVATWSESFRTDFGRIGEHRAKLLSHAPIIALTGSATELLVDHLSTSLQLGSVFGFKRIQGRFKRSELFFVCRPMNNFKSDIQEPIEKLMEQPREISGSGVIFVRGPKETHQVRNMLARAWMNDPVKSQWMQSVEIVSSPLSDEHRDEVLAHLKSGHLRVVIATVCLGMGIDIPHLYTVICYGNFHLNDLVQQLGRAARDGKFAFAIVYYPTSGVWHNQNISVGDSDEPHLFEVGALLSEGICLHQHLQNKFSSREIESAPQLAFRIYADADADAESVVHPLPSVVSAQVEHGSAVAVAAVAAAAAAADATSSALSSVSSAPALGFPLASAPPALPPSGVDVGAAAAVVSASEMEVDLSSLFAATAALSLSESAPAVSSLAARPSVAAAQASSSSAQSLSASNSIVKTPFVIHVNPLPMILKCRPSSKLLACCLPEMWHRQVEQLTGNQVVLKMASASAEPVRVQCSVETNTLREPVWVPSGATRLLVDGGEQAISELYVSAPAANASLQALLDGFGLRVPLPAHFTAHGVPIFPNLAPIVNPASGVLSVLLLMPTFLPPVSLSTEHQFTKPAAKTAAAAPPKTIVVDHLILTTAIGGKVLQRSIKTSTRVQVSVSEQSGKRSSVRQVVQVKVLPGLAPDLPQQQKKSETLPPFMFHVFPRSDTSSEHSIIDIHPMHRALGADSPRMCCLNCNADVYGLHVEFALPIMSQVLKVLESARGQAVEISDLVRRVSAAFKKPKASVGAALAVKMSPHLDKFKLYMAQLRILIGASTVPQMTFALARSFVRLMQACGMIHMRVVESAAQVSGLAKVKANHTAKKQGGKPRAKARMEVRLPPQHLGLSELFDHLLRPELAPYVMVRCPTYLIYALFRIKSTSPLKVTQGLRAQQLAEAEADEGLLEVEEDEVYDQEDVLVIDDEEDEDLDVAEQGEGEGLGGEFDDDEVAAAFAAYEEEDEEEDEDEEEQVVIDLSNQEEHEEDLESEE